MSAKKEHHNKITTALIRAGNHLVNPDHIAFIQLPEEGDENNTLNMKLSTGENFTLTGDDATAALEELGGCCDVEPDKEKTKAKGHAHAHAKKDE